MTFVLVRREDIDFDPANALPPTDEELDELCRVFWPDAHHWRPEHARNMSSHRFADREQMRAFLSALTGQRP